MIKKLTYLTFAFVCIIANAQEEQPNKGYLNIGIESNGQWYVDDDKIKLGEEYSDERIRTNSYLKADYFIGKWEFGVQVESYTPKAIINYAPGFEKTDIGTVYARYNNSEIGLDITAGHFYEQFGSGLALRSWEDRQLGINNAIFGGKIAYEFTRGAKATILGGRQRIGMGFDLAHSVISGANLDINLSEVASIESVDWSVGTSFVGRYEDLQDEHPTLDKMTKIYSIRTDISKGGYYAGIEYLYKDKDALVEGTGILKEVREQNQYDGNALLINLGYSQRGFGLDINLRRMENMSFFSERDLAGNTYNQGVINYIPALTKQYDFALQNIYVYQAQGRTTFYDRLKAGEIGGQFDLFYQFKRGTPIGGKYGTYLAVNGSFWNALDIKEVDFPNREVEVGFFDLGRKYYNDIGIEARKKLSEKWHTTYMFVSQYFNKKYVEETSGEFKTYIASAEAIYKFSDTKSLRVIGQHLWADGDMRNWAGATVEYAPSLKWSFYVHDIYNYGNDNKDKRIHYYNVGGAFVKGATRIGMSYGRQRGGMICVGGVCRLVPESSGLSLNISTNF